MKICTVEGCDKRHVARGYCSSHYKRYQAHGADGVALPIRTQHGLSSHALYTTWGGMINRCHNPNNSSYYMYGARGIVVCDRWRKDFATWLSDMGERPDGMTLDRIDPDGPYAPDNCRWATLEEQRANWSVEGAEKQRIATSEAAKKRWSSKASEV